MHRLFARLPQILLASTFALTAFAAAPALSAPAPAAAPHDLSDPLHPCTVLLCLPQPGKAAQATTPTSDAASGLPSGKRMHKPYTVNAAPADNPAAAQPVSCAATDVQPVKVASDPEEGGQVARTAKPGVTEISVSKKTDTASGKLMESAPPAASACPTGQH